MWIGTTSTMPISRQPSMGGSHKFLHTSAINFVIVGAVHLQLSMLFFSVVRLGKSILRLVHYSISMQYSPTVDFAQDGQTHSSKFKGGGPNTNPRVVPHIKHKES